MSMSVVHVVHVVHVAGPLGLFRRNDGIFVFLSKERTKSLPDHPPLQPNAATVQLLPPVLRGFGQCI